MNTLGLPVMITVTPADFQDRDAPHDMFRRLRLTQPQITRVRADRDHVGDLKAGSLPLWRVGRRAGSL